MFFALLGLALAVQPPASPACPSSEAILHALAVKEGAWEAGCGRLKDGRTLIAAVHRGAWTVDKHQVLVAIAGPDASRNRVEIPFWSQEPKEIAQATSDAEDWTIVIKPARLGKDSYVRLSALVHHGEDYFVGEEIVVLLRVNDESISLIWTGLGDRLDRRFDSCVLDTRASFSLTADGRLARRQETRRSFRNAGVDAKLAVDLRKKCVAPPQHIEIFPTRR